jgi:hypothetical protein
MTPMSDRRLNVDFVVEKPSEGILLAVELQNTDEPSREWAAEALQMFYTYVGVPPTRYFLLAHPTRLYLWKNPDSSESMRWVRDSGLLDAVRYTCIAIVCRRGSAHDLTPAYGRMERVSVDASVENHAALT